LTAAAAIAVTDARGADDGAGTLGAANFIVNGLEYEITGPDTVAVVGFTELGTSLVIPKFLDDPYDPYKIYRVNRIADGVFYGCSELVFVDAQWIEYIGEYAFADCTGLKCVSICRALEIGEGAFSGCEGLGTVTVTEQTHWADGAFGPETVFIFISLYLALYFGAMISYVKDNGDIEIKFAMPGYIPWDVSTYDMSNGEPLERKTTGINTVVVYAGDCKKVGLSIGYPNIAPNVEVKFTTEKRGDIEYMIDEYGWTPLPYDGMFTVTFGSKIRLRAVGVSEGYMPVFSVGHLSAAGITIETSAAMVHISVAFVLTECEVTLPEYNEGTFLFSEPPLKTIGNKAWFSYGTDVTITAIPYSLSGYAFEWTSGGTVSGDRNETITLTVKGDTVLDGTAIPNEYEIFVNVNVPPGSYVEYFVDGGAANEVPADGTIYVPFDAIVTFKAPEADGHTFQWSKGAGLSISGNEIKFVVKGDRDILGTYAVQAIGGEEAGGEAEKKDPAAYSSLTVILIVALFILALIVAILIGMSSERRK